MKADVHTTPGACDEDWLELHLGAIGAADENGGLVCCVLRCSIVHLGRPAVDVRDLAGSERRAAGGASQPCRPLHQTDARSVDN